MKLSVDNISSESVCLRFDNCSIDQWNNETKLTVHNILFKALKTSKWRKGNTILHKKQCKNLTAKIDNLTHNTNYLFCVQPMYSYKNEGHRGETSGLTGPVKTNCKG